jgi:hypothetical protein
MKHRQELSISEQEHAACARERRLGALRAHADRLCDRKRAILTGLISGASLADIANRLELPLARVMQEVAALSCDQLSAPPGVGLVAASGDSLEAVPCERLESRAARYFPTPHAVPESEGWRRLRLGEFIRLGELEIWLLANIGAGNTGAVDLRQAQDRWQLGLHRGYWHAWFKYERDYQHFVATWFAPQLTSHRVQ